VQNDQYFILSLVATLTPMFLNFGFMMFEQWPRLATHAATISICNPSALDDDPVTDTFSTGVLPFSVLLGLGSAGQGPQARHRCPVLHRHVEISWFEPPPDTPRWSRTAHVQLAGTDITQSVPVQQWKRV